MANTPESFPVLGPVVIAAGLLFTGLPISCDESLPPRESPPTFLAAEVGTVGEGQNVEIYDGGTASLNGAFQVGVRSVYDEVLEGPVGSMITLEVWLRDHPEVRTTVRLGESDLINRGILRNHLLTLHPDSSARFVKQWKHRGDNGVYFWDYAPIVEAFTPSGVRFCQSGPVRIVVRGIGHLYKLAAPAYIPEQEFTLRYALFDYQCVRL